MLCVYVRMCSVYMSACVLVSLHQPLQPDSFQAGQCVFCIRVCTYVYATVNACLDLCVYLCLCMYVHVTAYVRVCVCVCVCVYMCVQVCAYTNVCVCTCLYVCVYASVCVWVCTYVCVLHVCAQVYIYVHALYTGKLLFNGQLVLVSFPTAFDHVTTISIKKSFTSIASMLSGFSFFSTVVCL